MSQLSNSDFLLNDIVEVLSELHRSQESAYNLRDTSRQGHFNRAKLCSKIIKYPHVEDYIVSSDVCHSCALTQNSMPRWL